MTLLGVTICVHINVGRGPMAGETPGHYTPRDRRAPRLASSHGGLEAQEPWPGGGSTCWMVGEGLAGREKRDAEFFLRANTRIIFTVKLILSGYWLKHGLS